MFYAYYLVKGISFFVVKKLPEFYAGNVLFTTFSHKVVHKQHFNICFKTRRPLYQLPRPRPSLTGEGTSLPPPSLTVPSPLQLAGPVP